MVSQYYSPISGSFIVRVDVKANQLRSEHARKAGKHSEDWEWHSHSFMLYMARAQSMYSNAVFREGCGTIKCRAQPATAVSLQRVP